MTNNYHGTLYIGVTKSLYRRIQEHKNGTVDGFTKRYKLKRLVYYEKYQNIQADIQREKQLKARRRKRKVELIEENNPNRDDLAFLL